MNGTIRWYPDPTIAGSWDPNWGAPIRIDCSQIPQGPPMMMWLPSSAAQTDSGVWTRLEGSLVQISFDGKQLCGVNNNDDIWCASDNIRGKGAPSWRQLPGKLTQIAVYGDSLFGVNRANMIYFGSAVSSDPSWRQLPGSLRQVSTDNKQVCGVNSNDDIWCADSNIRSDPNWRQVPGKLIQVEVLNGRLIGVNRESEIFTGQSYGDPKWVKLPGSLRQVSFDGVRLCGTNSNSDVWCADSGLLDSPNWTHLSGKSTYIVVEAGELFAVDRSSTILYRPF
jgi:hypothetical protein